MKPYRFPVLLLVMALILSACNMPTASKPTEQNNPDAVFTAAAETVVAQLTQNALLLPTNPPAATIAAPTQPQPQVAPTNTSQPLITSSAPTATSGPVSVVATSVCDAAQFITDVTIPDGTAFNAGATYIKTWRIKNIGTCTWNSSYSLVRDSGDAMGGPLSQPLEGSVAPGGAIDISVSLQAPTADGTYRGYWGITNASGVRIPVKGGADGKSFYVEIKVGTGTGTGSTPVSGEGKFAVTSVNFSVERNGACESLQYTIKATVTTNKAGVVTYTWIRSDGATGDSNSGSLTFDSAGSKTLTYTWTFGGGNQWVELYVDKPNHQQFGRANLNCP